MANDSDEEHYNNELLNIDMVIKDLWSGLTQDYECGCPECNKVVQSIVEGRIYLFGAMTDHHVAGKMLHEETLEHD